MELGFRMRIAFRVFCVLLAVLPIWRLCAFLASQGENTASNDDLMIAPLIGEILAGRYAWENFFRDTFLNGHAMVFPTLVQAFLAEFFAWDQRIVLGAGVGIGALTVFLLFDAMTASSRGPARWCLLPWISALFFFPSQVSSFEFGFAAMTLGLGCLGFALSLWSVLRVRTDGLAAFGMVLGGLLASWSYGGGVFVWPAALWAAQGRWGWRKRYFLAWATGAWLASLPYLYYGVLHPFQDLYFLVEQRAEGGMRVAWPGWRFFLEGLGLPWAPVSSPQPARGRGFFGLLLIGATTAALLRGAARREATRGALAVLLFGALNLGAVALFRGNLAHWYSKPAMLVWIGLSGAAWLLCRGVRWGEVWKGFLLRAEFFQRPLLGALCFAAVAYLGISSGASFTEYSYFIRGRSPVSASCLRNEADAPTYCLQEVFFWPPGRFEILGKLARPLREHRLSVFGPRQTVLLQGDFILDSVVVRRGPGMPPVHWLDESLRRTEFRDPRRLTLFLHAGNAVEWKVAVPVSARSSAFIAEVALSPQAPRYEHSDGMTFRVEAVEGNGASRLLWERRLGAGESGWVPIKVPLEAYAGRKLTLRLSGLPGGNPIHDWGLWRAPRLDFEGGAVSRDGTGEDRLPRPSNTSLSEAFPTFLEEDALLQLDGKGEWREADGAPGLCLGEFSHLTFEAEAPSDSGLRVIRIILDTSSPVGGAELTVPLLAGDGKHRYAYPLRLLEGGVEYFLKGIKLGYMQSPNSRRASPPPLREIRWVRATDKVACR